MNVATTRVRSNPRGGEALVTTGNAKVFDYESCEVLLSYGTPVAVRLKWDIEVDGVLLKRGAYQTARKWSHTTTCHIGRWNARDAEEIPQAMIEAIYSTVRWSR